MGLGQLCQAGRCGRQDGEGENVAKRCGLSVDAVGDADKRQARPVVFVILTHGEGCMGEW